LKALHEGEVERRASGYTEATSGTVTLTAADATAYSRLLRPVLRHRPRHRVVHRPLVLTRWHAGFIPSDVLQSTTGFSPATTATPGVSLPNPATEGSAGFVVIGSQGQVTPPWEWHEAALSGISAGVNELAILIRPDLEDQEQSWVFNAGAAPVPTGVSGSSAFWACT
jgi:hypothetical protein